ncbi:TPA: DUF4238 domain-containing protein [Vibrio parahaemolyticus]|nr:DUF4238 domain-containing protein [Vibrio parahaemolyticus]HCH0720566.1 DUF4238 domain-containing protein [Vibrio parahaemolyticus]HCM1322172.1 DUF4238 domain-containing protein [Vibrio parahaemolyticus]
MNKSKNKKQHYISAFHLYHFTNDNQKSLVKERRKTKIYHFDIRKNKINERPIEQLATESYLFSFQDGSGVYNHDLDEKLKATEDNAAKSFDYMAGLYDEIVTNRRASIEINNSHIDSLIEFISWQWKRDPELIANVEKEIIEKTSIFEGRTKEAALRVIEQSGTCDKYNVLEVLNNKSFVFLMIANDVDEFVVTDKPFVRFNPNGMDGIAFDDTEIYYPITSKIMLVMLNSSTDRMVDMIQDSSQINELNKYNARQAYKYVFASNASVLEKLVHEIS